jgi:hypothetical protein
MARPLLHLLFVLSTGMSLYVGPVRAAADIAGAWVINEDESDDPHEQLEGLSVIRATPISPSAAERSRQGKSRQAQVYSELELANVRRSMRAEADVGELARILNTEGLTITENETGYQFKYSDGFSRTVTPRVGGPVYTAKGNEFIPDELGRSMVYWRGKTLVIETLLAPRGNMSEEISLKPGQRRLEIHTKISNPDWLIDAEIFRMFDPPSP